MIIFSNKEGGVNMDNDKQYFLRALGMNIKRLREEKNLSQEELANLCGYSESNARSIMSKIEKGVNDVPASKLKKIAAALGVPVTELMNCTEQVQEIKACELFEQCYGENIFNAVKLYLSLDEYDRTQVMGVMQGLLMNEKYSAKEGLKNA